jgi:hypothetical protein
MIKTFVYSGLIFLSTLSLNQVKAQEIKPRPSTLHKILLESDNFPKKELVLKTYNSLPFPDQYIDFALKSKSFNPKKYVITEADRTAVGKSSGSKLGKMGKSAMSGATGGLVDSSAADIPFQIEKYLKENQVAKQMAAKWLDIQDGRAQIGNYMMQRALSGISEKEKMGDMDTYKANLLLKDVELMANSFVIVNKMFFQENEPVVRVVRDMALVQADKISIPMAKEKAIKLAIAAYDKAKEGYTVFATSYLYQLDWNEEKAKLANDLFNNKNVNAQAAFDTTTLFNLAYLGKETSMALVTFSLKEKRTEEQIIQLAVKRALNNAMAKLQRSYEAFRPMFRLASANPFTAQIGTKEGVQIGDKFDVLEGKTGDTPGIPVWKKVASISVGKKDIIWDNESGEPQTIVAEDGSVKEITSTTFKGSSKKANPYCLIRLAK